MNLGSFGSLISQSKELANIQADKVNIDLKK